MRHEAVFISTAQADPLDEESRRISELRLRIERRLGEMLAETVQHEGGRPSKQSHRATVLPDGITRTQSSRWQKLAAVPAEDFEAYLAGESAPSLNGALKYAHAAADASKPRESPAVSGDRERSKTLAASVVRENPALKPGRGRGSKGGNREAARRAGVDEQTVRAAKKHTDAMERYPFLDHQGVTKSAAVGNVQAPR